MVFSLLQSAETGTVISSRDRNRDVGGTKVGFEKRILSREVLGRKVNIGERGSQGVAPTSRVARWRDQAPGGASPVDFRAFGCLLDKEIFWNFSGIF